MNVAISDEGRAIQVAVTVYIFVQLIQVLLR